ncbi:MAG: N-acetylmuramoyl-L-alanine amidase [Anaerolineae bacterium]|nr:N-acetylmuramoyl-L-alanine amidase [Anaerolineae bacterium]
MSRRWLVLLPCLWLALLSAAQAQNPAPVCFWSAQGAVCVPRAAGVGKESLRALLAGPTTTEQAQGLWSAIPAGTALRALDVQPDRTVIVRLEVPERALAALTHESFEGIVEQIAATLEPLGWRDLRLQVRHPATGKFVPLADFLPPIPAPRKETELLAPAQGQPPAPGQGRPRGALTGKTIYVSAGHGWLWNSTLQKWRTQRPPYPYPPYEGPIIEDHNNAEAVNQYLLHYLWNAGAMVWPVRERDMNGYEVIVDNDNPAPGTGYSESGAWTTTSYPGTGYAGGSYRWTLTAVSAPTAAAIWTATIPFDGYYAVYVWYRPGSNRSTDAQYIVHHAGGTTTYTVNQQEHGLTWHYIGSYAFRGGEVARIVLTNLSSQAGRVVIADAVRIGGGTFSSLAGIETSAPYAPYKPWWEVGAFYYTQRMGMEAAPDDITARPIYARWEHAGTYDDAVYISWHSNGATGYQTYASGTETYVHNGEGLPRTGGSLELQNAVHTELINDLRAGWDPAWPDRGRKTKNLGELRLLWDDDPTVRMPGVLVEVAFHDHPTDTDALKEPYFNMLAARALYQGIVKYFERRDGVDLKLLPEPPTHLRLRNLGSGRVRVDWQPSPTDNAGLAGDAATGYRVYTSTNGLGWSNGTPVATTAYTLTGLTEGQLIFVRVTGTNEGGESFPSETLAARVGSPAQVLLVSDFRDMNRTMAIPETDPVEGYNMRLFLERMNSYNYTVQHGEAVPYPFDSSSSEAVRSGFVRLSDYALVDWILGEEGRVPATESSLETLDSTERALLSSFLSGGGALFLSGSEAGRHLAQAAPQFYNNVLRARYEGDDAGTYQVWPVAGSLFDGLGTFRFDAPRMYDADFPDRLAPLNGSTAALLYDGGEGGVAAIQYENPLNRCERLVYLGFPFETIWPQHRPTTMARVLDFLGRCLGPAVRTDILSPGDGSAHATLPNFAGVSTARGNELIELVEVQLQRAFDGYYWVTGTACLTGTLWSAEEFWITVARPSPPVATLSWTYPLPCLSDGEYTLRARARAVGGTLSEPAEVSFIYDTVPPRATVLITPTGGITITALPALRLEWEAVPPDGGSALAYTVRLDGRFYTTTNNVYTLSHVFDGPHLWGVQVFDAAGNRSAWATDSFYVARHNLWLPVVLR